MFKMSYVLLYMRQSYEIIFFWKRVRVSQNKLVRISIGPSIREWRLFKKLKIMSILGPFLPKIKIANFFNFPWTEYFGRDLSFLEIWHVSLKYCWNYGPSNLQCRFIYYRVGQLNRQTKISVTLPIHVFESHYWRIVW